MTPFERYEKRLDELLGYYRLLQGKNETQQQMLDIAIRHDAFEPGVREGWEASGEDLLMLIELMRARNALNKRLLRYCEGKLHIRPPKDRSHLKVIQ